MKTSNLDLLKDIYTPTESLLWPLAIGWWIMIMIFLIILIILINFFFKKNKVKNLISEMFNEIEFIEIKFNQSNNYIVAYSDISMLMRNFLLSLSKEKKISSIYSKNWLNLIYFLSVDKNLDHNLNNLIVNPYLPNCKENPLEMLNSIKNWLKTIPLKEEIINQKIQYWFTYKNKKI